MSLSISHFWTATVLTFLKNGLELLKEKALKMIPKHGRTEAQSWPLGSRKNNILDCITLQLALALAILQNVLCSVIRIGFFNIILI